MIAITAIGLENRVTRVLLLLSSANQLKMADGSISNAGFAAPESLAAYEQLTAVGNEVVVATPDGFRPTMERFSLDPVFQLEASDSRFIATLSGGPSAGARAVGFSLHHVVDLDLMAAQRVSLVLREAGVDRAEAVARVISAGRTAVVENRSLVSVLAEDGVAGPPEVSRLKHVVEEVAAGLRATAEHVEERLGALTPFSMPVALSSISDADVATFAAVLVPGGHGSMVDLVDNVDVHRVLGRLHARDALIASQGCGVAHLLSAPATAGGQWLFEGYRMTSFTDEEEAQTPYGSVGLPWSLETALKNAGAVFTSAVPWRAQVVVDRNLITAQNAASTPFFLKAVRKALEHRLETE